MKYKNNKFETSKQKKITETAIQVWWNFVFLSTWRQALEAFCKYYKNVKKESYLSFITWQPNSFQYLNAKRVYVVDPLITNMDEQLCESRKASVKLK